MSKINFSAASGAPAVRTAPPPTFAPSPQQAAIFLEVQLAPTNLLIEAVAGAGKTTTLVEVCKFISGNAVFLAFNKKIATDIGLKLRAAGIEERTVKASTFHAAGFAAWRREAPGVRVNDEKSDQLMDELKVPQHLRAFVSTLASLAKQAVYGVAFRPQGRDDWLDMIDYYDVSDKLTPGATTLDQQAAEGIDWTERLLVESVNRADQLIDFDDMIWVPLVRGVRFWQYDWVLVDEAQDTNAARRMMAESMLRSGGRLIAVGDRHQAIYGFTGADADALDLVATTFGCKHMPLTTTYRCPKAVVRHAQQWVSHIEAAESAPEGTVRTITKTEFEHQYLTERDNLGEIKIRPSDAILCRNTKPLVQLAFDLIRRKIPCHVEGREIGKGLLALARRWRSAQTIGQLEEKLHEYRATERTRLHNKKAKLGVIEDKVDTLFVLMEQLDPTDTVWSLEQIVNDLFQDSTGQQRPSVTLSTVHKAKGREWDRVFLLGRDELMPSKYAVQPWQQEQERNLCYVAVTRAKRELIEICTLSAPPEDYVTTKEWETREPSPFDNLDDAAAAASDTEAGYDPFQVMDDNVVVDPEKLRKFAEEHPTLPGEVVQLPWQEGDIYEKIETFREEAGLYNMIPEDKYRALYEQHPPVTAVLRSVTYRCPAQGRDISVGPEDFTLSIDYGENFFLTIRKCFCGEQHAIKVQ